MATGHEHGYHVLPLGWYESELIRRTDPQHRTVSQHFKEEVANWIGVEEFYMGLPPSVDLSRIARLEYYYLPEILFHLDAVPSLFCTRCDEPRSLTFRAVINPFVWRPSDLVGERFRDVEIPGGNGISRVFYIAKAYGTFATGATPLMAERAFSELIAPSEATDFFDEIMRVPTCFSLAFLRPNPSFRFGIEHAFGMPGLGGSFAFGDPDVEIGYPYPPNNCGYHLWDDPRDRALRLAIREGRADL